MPSPPGRHCTVRCAGSTWASAVRFTEVVPGAVHTEFSLVRFASNAEGAAQVYAGITPLTAEDVAETIVFAATRPSHVNIDQIVLKPRDQHSAMRFHRRSS